jgi:serine/threonine protein phosphatase PrpC
MLKNHNYIYSSRKGSRHKENWDNLLVIDEPGYSIFAVFDGVSSAKHGKEAALQAKQFIKEHYKNYINGKVDIKKLMYDLNQYLVNSDLKEPYSTYCMVYYDKQTKSYYYSWLGDSRLYVITNQFVEQLTHDDSYSEHVITKFLGNSDLHLNDFRQLESTKQDNHLLLCTDGFYRLFESNKLEFFDNFHKKSLPSIRERINSLIKGKNFDDSTFIFVK